MGGKVSGRLSLICGAFCSAVFGCLILLFTLAGGAERAAASSASPASSARHVGVASCAGSTCHGRTEPTGKVVRQNEIFHWQDSSSRTGAHSRAFASLLGPRGQAIGRKLNVDPTKAGSGCIGCHADPAYAGHTDRWRIEDGVGCEACHGGAGGSNGTNGWLQSHYKVNQDHEANISRGLYRLDNALSRAEKCLDCHYGSNRPDQFVSHRIMSAGHPRVTFELDLFSSLQQHHDEDVDYVSMRRKNRTDNVKMWAIGQAVAVQRATTLFTDPSVGNQGMFPEIYFFDCHSCHRRIIDGPEGKATWVTNPGRPIPAGMPPFNDENMIMLTAAAKVAAPDKAAKFEADSKFFHRQIAKNRTAAVSAAQKLGASAGMLASAINSSTIKRAETFAIIDRIASTAIAERLTDYQGSAQAVMAIDTLLNAMVREGYVSGDNAQRARGPIDRAYKAVRDPNAYRPADFRAALGEAANSIRALK